ncbi:MAG TPA: lipid-A-disaccharide synthase [Methylophilaceae bacterium]|nr:lipid-A-disaccharide synthase [Methylophilaceae bacterium]
MPTIGIVAGEASGDLLGSHLIKSLKQHRPDLQFVGVAGPRMQAEGAVSLFPMEKLAVRGLLEVLRHLPSILGLRRQLVKHFRQNPPDLFIGIDAPDFNLGLERKLKRRGIKTIHYVSPSIWAWRRGRVNKIRRAVSHMLVLFPHEFPLYEQAGIPATYVGHPLADSLPLEPDREGARRELKLPADKLVIAMLPGSRQSELHYMADLFVKTALQIHQQIENVQFLVPVISRETRWMFEEVLHRNNADQLPLSTLFGHAHLAMEAADVVLAASGTATLEAALLKRPMVIAYRVSQLSWQIVRHMLYLPFIGLPNILAGRKLVPELLQKDATPEKLAEALMQLVHDKQAVQEIQREFTALHESLRQNTEEKAAQAVLKYLP